MGRICIEQGFRSTPPREGRRRTFERHLSDHGVSIHAPTRGATRAIKAANARVKVFRSTPPREGRPVSTEGISVFAEFRSTPPREGRLFGLVIGDVAKKFRSTPPREGRRVEKTPAAGPEIVSIHAPTRGATGLRRGQHLTRNVSIPRPHARGDPIPVTGA